MLTGLNEEICAWLELYGSTSLFLWCVLGFVMGGCFGSFMTACVWRIPRGISIVWPPSHCPKCKHHLGLGENIPILGWVLLGGKCKNCKLPISPRYVLIELAVAILFTASAYLAAVSGYPLAIIPAWTLIVISIGSACTDCELRIIPDAFTYTGMVIALLCAFFLPFTTIPEGMTALTALLVAALQIAAAGVFGASARFAGRLLFKREALGWGDVKYLMVVAGLTNIIGMLFAIFAGSIISLIWVAYDAIKRGKMRHKFAYGPFLAAGALLWLFAGKWLLSLLASFGRGA